MQGLAARVFSIHFHEIPLEAFRELPGELRTESFFRANELVNAYVDLRAREVARAMGSGSPIAGHRAAAFEWIERKVEAAGPQGPEDRERLRERILAENAELAAAVDLIDAATEGYPAFLRGERDGSGILFDPARPGLWDRYFSNENPLYAAGNTLAAHATELALAGRQTWPPLRVLEVGAGCGSAAEALLDKLEGRIGSYLLTDISPRFLRKAKERLADRPAAAPVELDYRLLDLNRPWETWPLSPGEFDLVYAVNVLHAVRDLQSTLRGIHRLLARPGLLVLGECVRPARGRPVHPEFIFQLLDDFRAVALDPELRPVPGFLDAEGWRGSIARADFARSRFIPDFEAAVAAYPAHSLAAITAWK